MSVRPAAPPDRYSFELEGSSALELPEADDGFAFIEVAEAHRTRDGLTVIDGEQPSVSANRIMAFLAASPLLLNAKSSSLSSMRLIVSGRAIPFELERTSVNGVRSFVTQKPTKPVDYRSLPRSARVVAVAPCSRAPIAFSISRSVPAARAVVKLGETQERPFVRRHRDGGSMSDLRDFYFF
jgi:hypothetical protein